MVDTKENSISDDMLNQAANGVEGEATKPDDTAEIANDEAHKSEGTVSETKETEEAKQEEVKRESETDQQFRSRLGKRVSRIEDSMNTFINEMRSTMQTMKTASIPHDATSLPAQNEGEYISTEADVRRIFQQVEKERFTASRNYENNYLNHMAKKGMEEGLNDSEFTRLEELVKNAPLGYQDPELDAEKNFLRAMRVIDKERLANSTKKVNLKGDAPLATSTVSGAKIIDKAAIPIKLDKYAQEFVNYHKIPEDKVRGALKTG